MSASETETPKVSVITMSLNTDKFLRESIESVLLQTYPNIEHIIVDGGSTDNTIPILKEYPHLRWISEPEEGENAILDALWKGIEMATGDYIALLAISDGFCDKDWFKKSVEVLKRDKEVALTWGITQAISEDGEVTAIAMTDFLEKHPPQKMAWLAYYFATGHGFECNAVYRKKVFEICFPKNSLEDPYRYHPTLGLNYELNTRGYLPYFLPMITWFGRTHKKQRQETHNDLLASIGRRYAKEWKIYRKQVLSGRKKHYFRDGSSEIIRELGSEELGLVRKEVWRYRLKRKITREAKKIVDHI